MNIIRELRKRKGIQQKELALSIGVAQPTVSDWESNKKDPSGDRLKKLAEYFGVDELIILGKGVVDLTETVENSPKTPEARLLAKGVDKMSEKQRKTIMNIMTGLYPGLFEKENETDET